MKPVAAFAAGLWVGAVAAVAIGVFYLRVWELRSGPASPALGETLQSRVQTLQQDQVRSQTEVTRFKQTIAELQSRLDALPVVEARRQSRLNRQQLASSELPVEPWIVDAVVRGDTTALPRLEQAALQNNLPALDAVALLADRDNGEALTRVWNSSALNAATRQRAALLLAATVESSLPAEELLLALFSTESPEPRVREAALAGILNPEFSTPLQRSDGFPAPPHVRPDYSRRLLMVEMWHASVIDPQLQKVIDRVHAKLAQRIGREEWPGQ